MARFYYEEDDGVCGIGGPKVGQKQKEGRRYGPTTGQKEEEADHQVEGNGVGSALVQEMKERNGRGWAGS